MFCVKCGNQLRDGDRFCVACGNPVTQPPVQSPVQPLEQPNPTIDYAIYPSHTLSIKEYFATYGSAESKKRIKLSYVLFWIATVVQVCLVALFCIPIIAAQWIPEISHIVNEEYWRITTPIMLCLGMINVAGMLFGFFGLRKFSTGLLVTALCIVTWCSVVWAFALLIPIAALVIYIVLLVMNRKNVKEYKNYLMNR